MQGLLYLSVLKTFNVKYDHLSLVLSAVKRTKLFENHQKSLFLYIANVSAHVRVVPNLNG